MIHLVQYFQYVLLVYYWFFYLKKSLIIKRFKYFILYKISLISLLINFKFKLIREIDGHHKFAEIYLLFGLLFSTYSDCFVNNHVNWSLLRKQQRMLSSLHLKIRNSYRSLCKFVQYNSSFMSKSCLINHLYKLYFPSFLILKY